MRPKRQIFTGWAIGLSAIAAGALALPAAAEKASEQRVALDTSFEVADFVRNPEPHTDAAAVQRLVELYGPDSTAETALQRTYDDIGSVTTDMSALRKMSEATLREADCLATAIYYEARSESHKGQVAVAQVIQNRVLSRHYPDTICNVVYQGSERSTGCQFSFTCDGSMDRPIERDSWDEAEEVAAYVMTQTPRNVVGQSTHYHTDYVNPRWNKTLKRTVKVGTHIFYRFPFQERSRGHSLSLVAAPPV
ncbi:MAG: cell wall hydrolase [Litorimonas sp.]